VKYYFCHSLKVEEKYEKFHFACVQWYQPDPDCDNIGNPVQIWRESFQLGGPASFIPVQRMYSRFAFTKLKKPDCNKIVVSPIGRKMYL
jgi:hypothetical protein